MKRIAKLTPATGREIAKQSYQDGLQAMWEARWTVLGVEGKADWIHRHGHLPPMACPLLHVPASLHGVRSVLRGGPSMPIYRAVERIRRDL